MTNYIDDYIFEAMKVSERLSTCKSRKVVAALVNEKDPYHILAIGVNGPIRKLATCIDKDICVRREKGYKSGEGLHECIGVHAESNLISICAKFGISTEGLTVYVNTPPCLPCIRILYFAGIKRIKYIGSYPKEVVGEGFSYCDQLGIELVNCNINA